MGSHECALVGTFVVRRVGRVIREASDLHFGSPMIYDLHSLPHIFIGLLTLFVENTSGGLIFSCNLRLL